MDTQDRGQEEFSVSGGRVMDKAKELWHEGNIRRVVIRKGGERYLELPLNLAVIGTALAPQFAAVGAVVALATGCSIAVERTDEV
jgi:hypothetical protein